MGDSDLIRGYACPSTSEYDVGCFSSVLQSSAMVATPYTLGMTGVDILGFPVTTTITRNTGANVPLQYEPSKVVIKDGPTLYLGNKTTYLGQVFELRYGTLGEELDIDSTAFILQTSVQWLSSTETGDPFAYTNITSVWAKGITIAWEATDTAIISLLNNPTALPVPTSSASAGASIKMPGATSTSTSTNQPSPSGLSRGTIAGIAIGCIAFVSLILIGVGFYVRRLRRALKAAKTTKPEAEDGKAELDGLMLENEHQKPHEMHSPAAIFYELPTHERPVEVSSEHPVQEFFGPVNNGDDERTDDAQHQRLRDTTPSTNHDGAHTSAGFRVHRRPINTGSENPDR